MNSQPKQSRNVNKTAGAKDAKSLQKNTNRTVEAPDMPDFAKETALEERSREVAEKLGARGHGSKPAAVVRRVLRHAEQGYSLVQIAAAFKGQAGMPTERTLYYWFGNDSEFAEDYKSRYRIYVDNQVRELLPLVSQWGRDESEFVEMLRSAKRLPNLRGLKPAEKMAALDRMIQRTVEVSTAFLNAQDKRVNRTMQIAAKQLPVEWGDNTEAEANVTIFDINLGGPVKTLNLPGSPDGQNAAALKAGRWDQIRKGAKLGKSGSPDV